MNIKENLEKYKTLRVTERNIWVSDNPISAREIIDYLIIQWGKNE